MKPGNEPMKITDSELLLIPRVHHDSGAALDRQMKAKPLKRGKAKHSEKEMNKNISEPL